jgi:hypothetical protein
MERVVDEAQYVLTVLYRMRDEVRKTRPELFDPDAQERIGEAIARIQTGLRSTRLELTRLFSSSWRTQGVSRPSQAALTCCSTRQIRLHQLAPFVRRNQGQ